VVRAIHHAHPSAADFLQHAIVGQAPGNHKGTGMAGMLSAQGEERQCELVLSSVLSSQSQSLLLSRGHGFIRAAWDHKGRELLTPDSDQPTAEWASPEGHDSPICGDAAPSAR